MLNTDGILLEFDEVIAIAQLKLILEEDADLAWSTEINEEQVLLLPPEGDGCLREGARYIVSAVVADPAGNVTDVEITFATPVDCKP